MNRTPTRSMLDKRMHILQQCLNMGETKQVMASKMGVVKRTIVTYIKYRNLRPHPEVNWAYMHMSALRNNPPAFRKSKALIILRRNKEAMAFVPMSVFTPSVLDLIREQNPELFEDPLGIAGPPDADKAEQRPTKPEDFVAGKESTDDLTANLDNPCYRRD